GISGGQHVAPATGSLEEGVSPYFFKVVFRPFPAVLASLRTVTQWSRYRFATRRRLQHSDPIAIGSELWAQIAALRKELASHTESFTEHDILAVPDEDLPGGPASAGGAPPKPGKAAKPAAPPKP